MSEVRHTPGPWHVGGRDACTVYDKYAQRLANSSEGVLVIQRSDAECKANARLIAAAPDFYQTARAIEWALQSGHDAREVLDENSPLRDALRDAIAKAEGVTP